jgi:CubicO group peptidase (beta-lactamase class C family)
MDKVIQPGRRNHLAKIKIEASMIHGSVSSGFEEVETEFKRNFAERDELGAACTIYYKGEKVVDLWGGYRDEATLAPWEKDTLVLVFSTTKGFAALAVAVAHSQGLLDYDEKVATYWPEFADNGKENITVRQLLEHKAGLCAIDEPLDLDMLANLDVMAAAIAKQKPAWEPGTCSGYHAWSLGWYQNELIRRVDPQHRSIGQFFQDEIAKPLNAEFYIGLPADVPDSRIATIKDVTNLLEFLGNLSKLPLPLILAFFNPKSLTQRAMNNPPILLQHTSFNRRDVRSVEIPSGNGIGQVRAMAKIYSVFATGGDALKLKTETLAALHASPVPPSLGPRDEVLKANLACTLGFCKPAPYADYMAFGSSSKAFGFAGAGGSFAFADPDAQVGYAYAMNRMGGYRWDDPREKSLRDAFYKCLKKMEAKIRPTSKMQANC